MSSSPEKSFASEGLLSKSQVTHDLGSEGTVLTGSYLSKTWYPNLWAVRGEVKLYVFSRAMKITLMVVVEHRKKNVYSARANGGLKPYITRLLFFSRFSCILLRIQNNASFWTNLLWTN